MSNKTYRRDTSAIKTTLISITLLACPLALLALSPGLHLGDDAYIAFRYSRNLANGHGLVFNAGERVEGVTSLLWTVLLAIPEALGVSVEHVAFWLGLGFASLALRETGRLARQLNGSRLAQVAAMLLLAVYPSFWRAAANGLESGLLAFLLTRTACLAIGGQPLAAGLTAGLLFMTRPDTLLVVPLIAAFQVVRHDSPRGDGDLAGKLRRQVLPLLVPWVAIIAAVTSWRFAYYGDALPNTIAAKTLPLSSDAIRQVYSNFVEGLEYCTDFLSFASPLALGSLVALLLQPKRSDVWLCIGILSLQLPVVLLNGGDWMAEHRLLAPYAPLLAGLSAVALDEAASRLRTGRKLPAWLVPGVLGGMLLLATAAMIAPRKWTTSPMLRAQRPALCYQTMAHLLEPVLRSGDRVSPEAIGVFGYLLPHVYVHDFLGLTDRRVATEGTIYVRHYGKKYPEYTYGVVRPHLIMVHSGVAHLRSMSQASAGLFEKTYVTYTLEEISACSSFDLISVRSDSKSRIRAAFTGVELRQIPVR